MTALSRITPAPVRKSIVVKAPQARAFEVFTARFGAWWPKSHHIGTAQMADGIIEPRTGGRWYEKGIDGSECEWGKVLAWEPPSRVLLSWHLNGQFKIDASVDSEVEVRFVAEDANTTRIELEHRISAPDAEIIRAAVDSPGGWSGLLGMYAEAAQAA
ncbi:MAG: SRPBCC family protein [Alphaproteobacteria bacterium]|nr:SRPBCC family protein [Alphaproteobacteria bacterium]MBV9063319.1 SRPBCC family protein [Alphaproteobacteria bacterium]